MGSAILAGLAFGLYYNRRRLMTVFGLFDGWLRIPLYARDPWKQIIMLMLISALITGVFPQEAFASGPEHRPVFYYYHTDRLGSSSILTDRTGDIVQQYRYTAFGKSRYENNTQAFSVTDRYTGQKLDEDTGLYFYGSRYYDPEIGRFIQPDSVVPTATTSQALNRYAYVTNNPLKYDDPTGHGNFFKEWIGTILQVILSFIPVIGFILATIISSAVSTLVNGGTFASFAIGVGIGIAAGLAAGAVFKDVLTGSSAMANFAAHPIETVAQGALTGALSGAASSAIYGGKTWDAVGKGALAGVAGVGVALGAEAALGTMGIKMATDTSAKNSVANGGGGNTNDELVIQACDFGLSGPAEIKDPSNVSPKIDYSWKVTGVGDPEYVDSETNVTTGEGSIVGVSKQRRSMSKGVLDVFKTKDADVSGASYPVRLKTINDPKNAGVYQYKIGHECWQVVRIPYTENYCISINGGPWTPVPGVASRSGYTLPMRGATGRIVQTLTRDGAKCDCKIGGSPKEPGLYRH